ncbi:hypothetical protein SAMN02745148_02704 [Modicisalibacter ilicicola DSM 19980]|uniref:DUF2333 family protein n=1 Tax=Modicisalibacter ilicicola DSM 19980 TaxID=1121942 RepID=A0A1M5BWE2_9GAMM|nr:DUF2333 family protein [Halomonas ilicicola]SHF46542.1 hypothetical protein SAMN02745148_02704 [Halomonas ilicicola DSM 19980]
MAIFRKRKRRTDVLERPDYGWIWKPLLFLIGLYLLVCIGLGIWWSQRPDAFAVDRAVAERRGAAATTPAARGAVTIATLSTTVDTLLDKPGGYLRNDVTPPGVWLDNMPSWEYGVLNQARLLAQALPAMSAGETALFGEAEEALDSNSRDWLYPSAEKRYARAVEALDGFLATLSAESVTGFVNDGDALAQWLQKVDRRLGHLIQRLSASIDDPEALRELGVDETELPEATPWYRIDNTFFEARGDAWALMHFLRAVERDYADLLAKAGASGNMARLLAELEMAQRRLWSPLVLNGSGFGIFANHSLLLANYIMSARDQVRALAAGVEGVEVDPATAVEDEAETPASPEEQGASSPEARDASSETAAEDPGAPTDGEQGDQASGQAAGEPAPANDEPGDQAPEKVGDEATDSGADEAEGEGVTPPEPAEAAPESPVAPPVSEEESQ